MVFRPNALQRHAEQLSHQWEKNLAAKICFNIVFREWPAPTKWQQKPTGQTNIRQIFWIFNPPSTENCDLLDYGDSEIGRVEDRTTGWQWFDFESQEFNHAINGGDWSVRFGSACAMHLHPARVEKAHWNGTVIDSTACQRFTTSSVMKPFTHQLVCWRQPSFPIVWVGSMIGCDTQTFHFCAWKSTYNPTFGMCQRVSQNVVIGPHGSCSPLYDRHNLFISQEHSERQQKRIPPLSQLNCIPSNFEHFAQPNDWAHSLTELALIIGGRTVLLLSVPLVSTTPTDCRRFRGLNLQSWIGSRHHCPWHSYPTCVVKKNWTTLHQQTLEWTASPTRTTTKKKYLYRITRTFSWRSLLDFSALLHCVALNNKFTNITFGELAFLVVNRITSGPFSWTGSVTDWAFDSTRFLDISIVLRNGGSFGVHVVQMGNLSLICTKNCGEIAELLSPQRLKKQSLRNQLDPAMQKYLEWAKHFWDEYFAEERPQFFFFWTSSSSWWTSSSGISDWHQHAWRECVVWKAARWLNQFSRSRSWHSKQLALPWTRRKVQTVHLIGRAHTHIFLVRVSHLSLSSPTCSKYIPSRSITLSTGEKKPSRKIPASPLAGVGFLIGWPTQLQTQALKWLETWKHTWIYADRACMSRAGRKIENHKRTSKYAYQLRRDSASTNTIWINRFDAHNLNPEARWFPQVKVPSTVPQKMKL